MKIKMLNTILVVFLLFKIVAAKNPVILYYDDQKQLKDYYSFLQSATFDYTGEVIPKLKYYLENNPGFDRVYNQLLQFYTYNNKIEEAKLYFDSLKVYTHFKKNSLWILAKIYSLQDNAYKSHSLYLEAFHAGTPSELLLIDFIDFDRANKWKFNSIDKIISLDLSYSLMNLSNAYYYFRQKKFKKTNDALNKVLKKNPEDLKALHILGNLKDQQQNFNDAKLDLEEGLRLSEKKGDLYATTYFLNSLGYIHNKRGKPEEAANYHTKALSWAKISKDINYQQISLGFLAGVYYEQNIYENALNYYNKAIVIAKLLNNYRSLSNYYLGKAKTLYKLKEYDQSINFYQQCEHFARKLNDEYTLLNIFVGRGQIFSKLNLRNLASDQFMRGYEISKNHPSEYVRVITSLNIATSLIDGKKYSEAKEIYLDFLNYYNRSGQSKDKAYIYWGLGQIDYLEKKYPSAKNNFFQAGSLATLFNNAANADKIIVSSRLRTADMEVIHKNYSDALKIYNEEIINNAAAKDSAILIEQYSGLANANYGMKNYEKALELYSNAITIIEMERKDLGVDQFRIGYFSEKIKVYDSMIQCCFDFYLEKGKKQTLERIFYLLEKSRARVLGDLVADDNSKIKGKESSPFYAEYLQECNNLQKIQRTMREDPSLKDSLKLALLTTRNNLIQKKLLLFDDELIKSNSRYLSLDSLITELNRANSGLLFYHISEEKSFVLAV